MLSRYSPRCSRGSRQDAFSSLWHWSHTENEKCFWYDAARLFQSNYEVFYWHVPYGKLKAMDSAGLWGDFGRQLQSNWLFPKIKMKDFVWIRRGYSEYNYIMIISSSLSWTDNKFQITLSISSVLLDLDIYW